MKDHYVSLYFNEKKGLIILPMSILKKNGLDVEIEPYYIIQNPCLPNELGSEILAAFKAAEVATPVEEGSTKDHWKKASGIKNYKKFSREYRHIIITRNETEYKYSEWLFDPQYGGYIPQKDDDGVSLPIDATALDLGNAILDTLSIKHEMSFLEKRSISLLCGDTLFYKSPADDFQDMGDAHTDAYQVFTYADDDSGGTYFGFSYATEYAEIDGAKVRAVWEKYYGTLNDFNFTEIEHSVFSYVANAITNERILFSYFFKDDDDWSEFLLCMDTSAVTPEIAETIKAEYFTIIESCELRSD